MVNGEKRRAKGGVLLLLLLLCACIMKMSANHPRKGREGAEGVYLCMKQAQDGTITSRANDEPIGGDS